MDLIITILPVVAKDLPISPRFTPYNVLSRCKFSTLTARQPMVEFYLFTFPRFSLRKKEHKTYFGKNRTRDFRTSRCADDLLDHSGCVPFNRTGSTCTESVDRVYVHLRRQVNKIAAAAIDRAHPPNEATIASAKGHGASFFGQTTESYFQLTIGRVNLPSERAPTQVK